MIGSSIEVDEVIYAGLKTADKGFVDECVVRLFIAEAFGIMLLVFS